jgi:membrane-bound metal-dependent hydrolase YbcI (DUF457 family)
MDYFFIAIFFSILPDLDIFLAPLRRIFKSKYLEHRGASHSYIIGVIISLIISLISSLFSHQPFYLVWVIGSLFYSLHVSMDLLTTTDVPYLYPISKKEHCFYIEKAGSMFTFINSLIFLLLPMAIFRFFNGMVFFQFYINFYTYFFIIYYIYRILSKLYISTTLEDGKKYFPGILPFYFRLYNYEINGNTIVSTIEKKSHFSKKSDIIRMDTTLTIQERIFLEKAKELNNKHYYFAKWTSFPVFVRKERIFSIRFFFIETFMRKRTMYVQYDFDLATQDLISSNQSSGPIQG